MDKNISISRKMYSGCVCALDLDWAGIVCTDTWKLETTGRTCTGTWIDGNIDYSIADLLLAPLWTCATITVTIIYYYDICERRRTNQWIKLQF